MKFAVEQDLTYNFITQLQKRLLTAAAQPIRTKWIPLPHQEKPGGDEWDVWVICAGRGSGKTRTGTEHVIEHLRKYGPVARVGIGGVTFSDARDVCMEGESGIITKYKDEFIAYNRSLGEAKHKDGGIIKFLGSEEPKRWNGPQWTMIWADELALWNEESWHQAMFGLRLPLPDGAHPWAIVTTTPKNRQFVRELMKEETTITSHASTKDNPHLDDRAKRRLYARYGGTRLGRQELNAEFIDDVEGALWQRPWIDNHRRDFRQLPSLLRVVVAIDPAVSQKSTSAETGITCAGLGADMHYYILHNIGLTTSPDAWARAAVGMYKDLRADRIVAEVNNGGDLVGATIKRVNAHVPYRDVRATRGKIIRAEPIAALYEQGRVHHVGPAQNFTVVEDQMCIFPTDPDLKIDRMESMVWAVTDLMETAELYGWKTEENDFKKVPTFA